LFHIFHIFSLFSSVFSLSFHYFLLYFQNLFTIFFCIFKILSLFNFLLVGRDKKWIYLMQKRIEMFYSTNQSHHWKLNQLEVAISAD
jgi:hypothetical protein